MGKAWGAAREEGSCAHSRRKDAKGKSWLRRVKVGKGLRRAQRVRPSESGDLQCSPAAAGKYVADNPYVVCRLHREPLGAIHNAQAQIFVRAAGYCGPVPMKGAGVSVLVAGHCCNVFSGLSCARMGGKQLGAWYSQYATAWLCK